MRTLALRASCSADNAFSTASAIRTAFVAQINGRETARPLYSTDRTQPRRPAPNQARRASSLSRLAKTIDKFGAPEYGANRESARGRGRDLQELQRDLRRAVRKEQGSHDEAVDLTSTQGSRASPRSNSPESLNEQPLAAESHDSPARGKFSDSETLTQSFSVRRYSAKLSTPFGQAAKDTWGRPGVAEETRPVQSDKEALNSTIDWRPDDLERWPRAMQKIGADVAKLSQQIQIPSKELVEKRRRSFDYRGLYIPPHESPQKQQAPSPWELGLDEIDGLSAENILQEEVTRFMKYWELTPQEAAARGSVKKATRIRMKKVLQDMQDFPISGSEKTGLAMITSDIDFRLQYGSNENSQQRSATRSDFTRLFEVMTKDRNYMLVTLRMANFPVINAQHVKTGIALQIVSSPPTLPQQEYTKQSIRRVPNLRMLYMLIHTTLSLRRLVDVFNGGIGSYGLFCMVAAAVNRQPNGADASLVDQLMHFLDFYSDFDPVKYGMSVNSAKLFKKHEIEDFGQIGRFISAAVRRGDRVRAGQWAIGKCRLYQPYLFCLQDPVLPTNDLGRKSNASKHLFATIRQLRDELRKNLELGADVYKANPPGERSLLAPLLGRCHEVYAARRQKLQDYEITNYSRAWLARKFESNTQPTAEQAETGLEDHEHVNAGADTSKSSEFSGGVDEPHESNTAENEQPGSRADVAADDRTSRTEVKSNENVGA